MSADRDGYIKGLREIADLLANHPEVPLPYLGFGGSMILQNEDTNAFSIFLWGEDARTRLAAIARAMGGAEKEVTEHGRFVIYRRFGSIAVVASAHRAEVCERVVTGTHEVEVEEPDPDALAALPTRKITKVVEDVEWVCGPLLAESTPAVTE